MLLAEGARVFITGRNGDRLGQVMADLDGDRATGAAADVRDEDAMKRAFAACRERFGPADVLVNNAGVGVPTPDLATTDLDLFATMFDTNARGFFLCIREALRDMKARGAGHICNVVSVVGKRTNPTAPLYCASKFAARGISSGLADQALKDGIRITDVNPGAVDTDYWGDRPVPREKFLSAADVATVIRFVLTVPDNICIREVDFEDMRFLARK
jgi:NADP-dependent 3-hydroxy acid dehydrogenase YdfG